MTVIAVIGGSSVSRKYYDLAFRAGAEIAKRNCVLVCGGLSGVMEAAAKGAKENKGMTIGILPGKSRLDANEYIDIAVPTGFGDARNLVIVNMADGVLAIDGKEGTLSEIAFTLRSGKPICGIGTYDIKGIIREEEPEKAIEKICRLIEAGK
jgi:uncharacterized protein (TIGR00725 family)